MIKIGNTDRTPVIRALAKVNPSLFSTWSDREYRIANSVTDDNDKTHYPFIVYNNLPCYTAADAYSGWHTGSTTAAHKWNVSHPFLNHDTHYIFDTTDRCGKTDMSPWKDGAILKSNYLGGASSLCRYYVYNLGSSGYEEHNLKYTAYAQGSPVMQLLNMTDVMHDEYAIPGYDGWKRLLGNPRAIRHGDHISLTYDPSHSSDPRPFPTGKTVEVDVFACLTDLDRPLFDTFTDNETFTGLFPAVVVSESTTPIDPISYKAAATGERSAAVPMVQRPDQLVHNEYKPAISWNEPGMLHVYFYNGAPPSWSGGDPMNAPDNVVISGTVHNPDYPGGWKLRDYCHHIVESNGLQTKSPMAILHSRGTYNIVGYDQRATFNCINFGFGIGGAWSNHLVKFRCIGISKFAVGVRIY